MVTKSYFAATQNSQNTNIFFKKEKMVLGTSQTENEKNKIKIELYNTYHEPYQNNK